MRRLTCFLAFVPLLLVFAARIYGQGHPPVTATLEGKVVNTITGAPIGSARVRTAQPNGLAEYVYTTTDADGHFLFTGLAPGNYVVNAEKAGFLRISEPRDTHPPILRTDLTHRDEHGALYANVTLQLTPYAVITGKVTELQGVPRANCPVEILASRPGSATLADGPIVVARTVTDDRGEYRVARLAQGTYYVMADKKGGPTNTFRTSRPTYYPAAINVAYAIPVQLAPGQEARADIRILGRKGVSVTGTITLPPTGSATPGHPQFTRLLLYRPVPQGVMNQRPLPEMADFVEPVNSRFEFRNVVPGRYTLMALTRADDAAKGTPVAAAIQYVEVGDVDIETSQVFPEPLRDVTGNVAFAPGCPASAVRLFVVGSNVLGRSEATVLSDPAGQFVLTGLTPARHGFHIEFQSNDHVPRYLTMARIGGQDVMREGFDYPLAQGEVLQLTVGCNAVTEAK